MTAADGDMTTAEFVRVLGRLKPHGPVSDAFIAEALERPGFADVRKSRFGYANEREHMVAWMGCQNGRNGTGAYSRERPNDSARRAYNRLLNAGSLLWIAEALGEDEAVLREASDAALAEPDYRTRCRIVRERIPWERVYELASKKRGLRGVLSGVAKPPSGTLPAPPCR